MYFSSLRRYFLLQITLSFIISPSINASSEQELFSQLQNDLEKYEKVATETRQNVDYMPYVISTLSGDEIQSLGVQSLREALELVPGVGLAVGMAGVQNPIFRGSNPFAYGQSKLIIDGVVVNDQLFGGYNQYLDLPVQLIHRIEVVRGPGSLQSDTNGYSGSINVITKSNRDDLGDIDNEIFATMGSNDYRMAGFIFNKNLDQGNISADFIGQRHNISSSEVTDRFSQVGEADQSLKNYNLGLTLNYSNMELKGRFAKNDSGVSYGQAFTITDDASDELSIDNNFIDFRYHFNVTPGVTGEIILGYLDEVRTLQNKVLPDDFVMKGKTLSDGQYFVVDYEEQKFKEGVDLKINTFTDHSVTLGVLFEQSKVKENIGQISTNNLVSFSSSPLIDTNDRKHFSFYVDDLWDVNEKLTFQFSLKFDHYNDVDNQLSPRIAAVYRQDNNNIYKLMITESFREPSWREQYLNEKLGFYKPNLILDPEKVRAYEMAYIHRFNSQSNLKLNAFLLDNNDQIHAQNATKTFLNQPGNRLWGIETEYTSAVGNKGSLNINYSYVNGDNVDNALANSAQHMIKGFYKHSITDNLTLSSIFKYVSDKGRIPIDPRNEDVDEYVTFDLSAEYKFKPEDVTLNLNVKNIFDESYYFPAPSDTYDEDFEQLGRQFSVSIKKGF